MPKENKSSNWTPRQSPFDDFINAQEKADKMGKFFRRMAKSGRRGSRSDSDSDSDSGKLAKKLARAFEKISVKSGNLASSSSTPCPATVTSLALMGQLLNNGSPQQNPNDQQMKELLDVQKQLRGNPAHGCMLPTVDASLILRPDG